MSIAIDYPVTLIGGGIVGLFCAKLLAQAKIPVAVIETQPPALQWENEWDARVSAMNAVSQRMLQQIGVWSLLQHPSYAPLLALTAWDSMGGAEITFDSADVGASALGAIVENREIMRVLWEMLRQDAGVEFICPAQAVAIQKNEKSMCLILDQNKQINTQLIIGADGANSWVRTHMSCEVKTRPYEQSAVVAVVAIEQSHQHTGWQVFLPNGPLALLPLSSVHHCAIVWSTTEMQANDLIAMEVAAFNAEINNAFGTRLGEIKLINTPKAIPLIMRHAKRYVERGIALIGDAAHTIHPLAGQGANLGLMDAACLVQSIIDAKTADRDIGSLRVLRRYERWRKGDNSLMLLVMRGLKELFGASSLWVTQIRNLGLNVTNQSNLLKNYFMQLAMGESSDLPDICRQRSLDAGQRNPGT